MTDNLIAIKVSRRTIAVAIFWGRNLHHANIRNLSSKPELAEMSAISFVSMCRERFYIHSAALEAAVTPDSARAAALITKLCDHLLALGVPCQTIRKQQVFEAYATAPLPSRRKLYPVITALWPQLGIEKSSTAILDAAAIGLYAQVERLLTHP